MTETVIDVLLVEDNADDAALTLRSLKKHNLAERVIVMTDGQEALDYLFGTGAHAARKVENRPRLVLLDLKLPKVDGLEVLERIKSDERTKQIPVVVLSSSGQERDVEESYNRGANSYVVKPVDFSKFARAVADVGRYWTLVNEPPV